MSLGHANLPDFIIIPDPYRAAWYAREGSVDRTRIVVVPNCPRLIRNLPRPILREILGEKAPPSGSIVLYHGAVGPDHGLETAIHSMGRWPDGSVFVIKGRCRPAYAERLKEAASRCGVLSRVLLHDSGFSSYRDHYAMIAGADIGWTVLEPRSANWRYSAYASNKRFEYMALGIPQVSDTNPGTAELVEGNGCGTCIPPDSADAAGDAIARLLNDTPLREEIGQRGRNLHLERFHYDLHFARVMDRITALSHSRVRGAHT